MASIGSISYRPVEMVDSKDNPPRFWTDVKVKQAWLGALGLILAAAAVAATVLTFTASLWFLAAAIPLYLAAGGTAWAAARMIDYDNPEQLAKVREECAKMPLDQIAKKHGWNRIFQYEIISPAQFDAAYRTKVEPLSLNDLISAYRFTTGKIAESRAQHVYRIPPPSAWKAKLEQETNGFNFSRMIANYSLRDLIQYDLLSPDTFKRSFIDFANGAPILKIIVCHSRAKAQLQAAHGSFEPRFIQQFDIPTPETWKEKFSREYGQSDASDIASRFSSHLPALLEYRIVSQAEYSILAQAKREYEASDQQIERARQGLSDLLGPYQTIRDQAKEIARQTYDNNIAHSQIRLLNDELQSGKREIELWFASQNRAYPDKSAEIRRERMERLDLLEGRMRRLKTPYEACLANAWALRNSACALADAAYEATRSSLERDMGREISQITKDRDLRLAAIDQEYRELQGREISLP